MSSPAKIVRLIAMSTNQSLELFKQQPNRQLEHYIDLLSGHRVENSTLLFSTTTVAPSDPGGEAPELNLIEVLKGNVLTLILPYTSIFLLTFVGNLMVILTIGLNKRMRTVTNAFLLNLSISDLLLGVFCMPVTLAGMLMREFVFGAAVCRIVPYLQAVSVSVSSWTLVTMSYERYFAICHPLKSRESRQTWSHSKRVIGSVWLLSAVLMLPIALLSELQPLSSGKVKCRESWPSKSYLVVFTVFLDIFLLVIPLVIMSSTYARIAVTLWKSMRQQSDQGSEGNGNCIRSTSSSNGNELSIATPKRRLLVDFDGTNSRRPSNNNTSLEELDPGQNLTNQSREVVTAKMSRPKGALVSFRCNQDQGLRRRQQRRIIKMLFVVVLEFFLCWTPLHVINTLSLFYPRLIYVQLGYHWISFFQLLAFVSSCTNPITYCYMNQNFRKSFRDLFRCAQVTGRNAEITSARYV